VLFTPDAIASEVRVSDKWLQDLCAFADTHCAGSHTEVDRPGSLCLYAMQHGRVPA